MQKRPSMGAQFYKRKIFGLQHDLGIANLALKAKGDEVYRLEHQLSKLRLENEELQAQLDRMFEKLRDARARVVSVPFKGAVG